MRTKRCRPGPTFYRALALVRRDFYIPLVRVRTVTQSTLDRVAREHGIEGHISGLCIELKNGRHVILISRAQSTASMVDTLAHEWAHALDNGNGESRNYHRDSWLRLYEAIKRSLGA